MTIFGKSRVFKHTSLTLIHCCTNTIVPALIRSHSIIKPFRVLAEKNTETNKCKYKYLYALNGKKNTLRAANLHIQNVSGAVYRFACKRLKSMAK